MDLGYEYVYSFVSTVAVLFESLTKEKYKFDFVGFAFSA